MAQCCRSLWLATPVHADASSCLPLHIDTFLKLLEPRLRRKSCRYSCSFGRLAFAVGAALAVAVSVAISAFVAVVVTMVVVVAFCHGGTDR